MRKKLFFLVFLILIAVIFLNRERAKIIFVKDVNDIQVYTDKDIKPVDTIISNLYDEKNTNNKLAGIVKKYSMVSKNETQFCDKTSNTSLVSNENKYNVISYQQGHTYYYYRETLSGCELIGKIENVNFTGNVMETYANNSVYASFESMDNYEINGMVRISNNEIHPFDNLSIRFSNPVAFSKGVLMIENQQSVVAFDDKNEELFRQNNADTGRRVLAINLVNNSFFMIVQKGNKYSLEAYNINNIADIKNKKPNLTYDISKYFKNYNLNNSSEIIIKHSRYYGSFTTSNLTLIVSANFSKFFVLTNADTALAIDNNMIYLKNDELYYVVDLNKRQRENFGNIKALSFKSYSSNLFFTVFDNTGQETHIKFEVK